MRQKSIKKQNLAEPAKRKINSAILLGLYTVIPLSFLVVLIDHVFLDQQLRDQWLPKNPSSLLLWAVFFVFPHIIASFVTLLDKTYWAFYKKRIIKALLVISAVVLFVNWLLPWFIDAASYRNIAISFFIFYAAYTMYHVLSQQLGIGMVLMQQSSNGLAYQSLRCLVTIGGALLYLMIFAEKLLKGQQWQGYSAYHIAQIASITAIALASVLGLYWLKESKRRLGTCYHASNLVMLWAVWLLSSLGYSFFVIAIPRLVHDITAFMIYSRHDDNRNSIEKHNVLYQKLAFTGLPISVLCVLAAIILANTLQCSGFILDNWLGFPGSDSCAISHYYPSNAWNALPSTMQIGFQMMLITAFFHYYIESFIWKKGSPHRQQINFS